MRNKEKAYQEFLKEIYENKHRIGLDDEIIDRKAYENILDEVLKELSSKPIDELTNDECDELYEEAMFYVLDNCFDDILNEEVIKKEFEEFYCKNFLSLI